MPTTRAPSGAPLHGAPGSAGTTYSGILRVRGPLTGERIGTICNGHAHLQPPCRLPLPLRPGSRAQLTTLVHERRHVRFAESPVEHPCPMDRSSRDARRGHHPSHAERLLQVLDVEPEEDARIPGLMNLRPLWKAALHTQTLAPLLSGPMLDTLKATLRLSRRRTAEFPMPPFSSLRLLVQSGIAHGLISGQRQQAIRQDESSLPILRLDEP